MSTYGCQTFDQNGKMCMDSNLMIGWRLIDSFYVAINVDLIKDYTSILPSGFTIITMVSCLSGGACHQSVVNGYVVTITAYSDQITGNYNFNNESSQVLVFLR